MVSLWAKPFHFGQRKIGFLNSTEQEMTSALEHFRGTYANKRPLGKDDQAKRTVSMCRHSSQMSITWIRCLLSRCVADGGTVSFLCQEKNRQTNNARGPLLHCPGKSAGSLYGPSACRRTNGRVCEEARMKKRMTNAQLICGHLKRCTQRE